MKERKLKQQLDGRTIFFGIIIPVLLFVLVGINLATGVFYYWADDIQTWEGSGYHWFVGYADPWRLWGGIVMETGIATSLLSWFLLPWFTRSNRLLDVCMWISIGLFAVGVIIFSAGFFV